METLSVVDQTGEYHHAQDQEEDQQRQLLGACLESMNQYFQSWRVSSELEESEDADDGEELEDVRVLNVSKVVLEQGITVEADGGHEVNPVQR